MSARYWRRAIGARSLESSGEVRGIGIPSAVPHPSHGGRGLALHPQTSRLHPFRNSCEILPDAPNAPRVLANGRLVLLSLSFSPFDQIGGAIVEGHRGTLR